MIINNMGEPIVLGFGNCIDYEIIWDSSVMEGLIIRWNIGTADINSARPESPEQPINTIRNLAISILRFMKSGTGGERFVESPRIIEEFSGLFEKRVTVGGTALRAAIAMRRLGYTAALHLVTVNKAVLERLPEGTSWVCGSESESCHPHLIVQFAEGTVVRCGDIVIKTARSNRIIYNNDPDSMAMKLNPRFAAMLSDARVLLISGFNAMRSAALLKERLNTLLEMMRLLPPNARVFYEDAGFHVPQLNLRLREALNHRIDIFSMNEDEMQNYLGRIIPLTDPGAVHAALTDLYGIIRVPILVVHTRYWALAYGQNAAVYAPALRGGITTAAARLVFGDDFCAADCRAVEQLRPDAQAAAFCDRLAESTGQMICCLPALNLEDLETLENMKKVKKQEAGAAGSVGLGDAFVGGFLPKLTEDHRRQT